MTQKEREQAEWNYIRKTVALLVSNPKKPIVIRPWEIQEIFEAVNEKPA